MTLNTAMVFTFIEFDKNWTRSGTVCYRATDTAKLIVVAESKTGVKTTYWFTVERGEEVMVSYYGNIVYIPAKCTKRAAGDKTKCQQP